MRAKTREEYEEELRQHAIQGFAGHDTLVEVGPGHWRISKAGNSHFWSDIVVMGNCAIGVWGDIEGAVFAYCSYKKPRQILNWMSGWNLGYQQEKASIGMAGIGAATTNAEVAIGDIERRLVDLLADVDDEDELSESARKEKEVFENAIERLRHGDSVGQICDYLYEEGVEAEDIRNIGDVVAPRVVFAIAAINRLTEMLDECDKVGQKVVWRQTLEPNVTQSSDKGVVSRLTE